VVRFLRWRSVANLGLQLALLAALIAAFFVRLPQVAGLSMEPYIRSGEYVLINTFAYRFGSPHRGEIVAFRHEEDARAVFIKRVIGLPGDTIQIKNGHPWVNGQLMDDPHGHFEVPDQERSPVSPRDNFGPVQVPAGKIFAMGDNRDRSYDSRFWGFADENDVEGKAFIIYWSWDNEENGLMPVRWSRIGMLVH